MKLSFRKVRFTILIALIVGLAAVIVAGQLEAGTVLRKVLVWTGGIVYLVCIVVMFIGFKCPACGAHFFKNALFLHECPVCGFRFNDFKMGDKVPLPESFDPNGEYSGDRLKEPKNKE